MYCSDNFREKNEVLFLWNWFSGFGEWVAKLCSGYKLDTFQIATNYSHLLCNFTSQFRLGIYTQKNILERISKCNFKEYFQLSSEHSAM